MDSEGKHMGTHNRDFGLHKEQEWAFVLKSVKQSFSTPEILKNINRTMDTKLDTALNETTYDSSMC